MIFLFYCIFVFEASPGRGVQVRTAEMFAHFCSHVSAWFLLLTLHEKSMRPWKGEYEIKDNLMMHEMYGMKTQQPKVQDTNTVHIHPSPAVDPRCQQNQINVVCMP